MICPISLVILYAGDPQSNLMQKLLQLLPILLFVIMSLTSFSSEAPRAFSLKRQGMFLYKCIISGCILNMFV